jgi:hypothetical protein
VHSAVLVRTNPDGVPLRGREARRSAMPQDVDLVVMAQGSGLDPEWAARLPAAGADRYRDDTPPRDWVASGLLGPGGRGRGVGTRALNRESALNRAALPVHERVWLCGDALTGPATVVEAMAQGRRVAEAILDAQPSRGAPRPLARAPRALVIVDEQFPAALLQARELAGRLRSGGLDTELRPVRSVGLADLVGADLVVIAAGLASSRWRALSRSSRAWLDSLPHLHGQRFAVVELPGLGRRAARSAHQVRDLLERRSASVVPGAAVQELAMVWQSRAPIPAAPPVGQPPR